MKTYKLLHIMFWAIVPVGTLWTAHLAIEKHSLYMAMLVLIDCISMGDMLINLEHYIKLKKQLPLL